MNITPETLPNQVGTGEVEVVQMHENNENEVQNEMKSENKTIRKNIQDMRDCFEDMQSSIESLKKMIEKKERKYGKLLTGIQRFAIFAMICIAGYWSISTIIRYIEEPVMSTTTIKHGTTFTWPTFTVEPHFDADTCYNRTVTEELQKLHNVNYTWQRGKETTYTIKQYREWFVLPQDFNWSVTNVSEMYLQVKKRPPFKRCSYHSMVIEGFLFNCKNTYYNTKDSFTPAAAKHIQDTVIIVTRAPCDYCDPYTIAIHPSTDHYYFPYPTAIILDFSCGSIIEMKIAVQEYHRVSTGSFPCIDDVTYSQVKCYEEKIIEYKVRKSGCYFPAITGYQPRLAQE